MDIKGADAPERFVMTFFRPVSKVERLLRQYPWLWAIEQRWYPYSYVTEKTIDGEGLGARISAELCLWVYFTYEGSGAKGWSGKLIAMPFAKGDRLADKVCIAYRDYAPGYQVSALAIKEGSFNASVSPITVYKAGKGFELLTLCLDRAG